MDSINPTTILVLAGLVLFLLIMMSGRKVMYFCVDCGHAWKGIKHHGGTAPKCPECGSANVRRK